MLSWLIRGHISDTGWDVVGHQLSVHRSKSERLVNADKHALFIKEVPKKIAATLDDTRSNQRTEQNLSFFLDYWADLLLR